MKSGYILYYFIQFIGHTSRAFQNRWIAESLTHWEMHSRSVLWTFSECSCKWNQYVNALAILAAKSHDHPAPALWVRACFGSLLMLMYLLCIDICKLIQVFKHSACWYVASTWGLLSHDADNTEVCRGVPNRTEIGTRWPKFRAMSMGNIVSVVNSRVIVAEAKGEPRRSIEPWRGKTRYIM